MIIELSNAKVTLKDSLNWGEMEKIQESMGDTKIDSNGATNGLTMSLMIAMQYKILDIAVIEVIDAGNVIPYSKDWVRGLSIEDAQKLMVEAVELVTPKKK